MRTPTEIEKRLLQAQQEILDCSEIAVERSVTGDLGETFTEAPALFSYLPDWQGVQLGNRLCAGSPRISELANFWHYGQASDATKISGEFRVTDLFTALLKNPPDLAWSGSTDEERDFFTQWRVIDDTPLSAMGQLAAIRIQPEVDPLEIWYYDMELTSTETRARQYVPLDLTYIEYLEQLAITKGTLGWQYLFTDEVMLGHPDFEDVRNQLTAMLELFPRLFPAWDYTELTRRLEARL
ncbi:hypothetical protein [Streptomyces niger]|uniref:hypothetical protein n=1 Tax=Streptomyces niger TaxID=66373 RepID=UPI0018FE8422|nr:hypothetical protein [Streptomyces niger]